MQFNLKAKMIAKVHAEYPETGPQVCLLQTRAEHTMASCELFSGVRSSALNTSTQQSVEALTNVGHHLQHVVIGKGPIKIANGLNGHERKLVHA